MKFYPFLILLTATTLFAQSQAQNGQGDESKGKRRPPREAVESCQNKSDGEACVFKGREERQLSGTCYRPDKNLPLACKPSEKH